jgi:hypothetical protein
MTNDLKRLIVTINKKYREPILVSQLDEMAGLGCHPFHMTLFGSVEKSFESEAKLKEFLGWYHHMEDSMEMIPSNKIKVTGRGTVLLEVKLCDMGEWVVGDMERRNSSLKKNCYVHWTQNDTLKGHITLGKIFDRRFHKKTLKFPSDVQLDEDYRVGSISWNY